MLSVFHKYSGGSDPHPVEIYDELIAQDILKRHHLFVLEGRIWLYRDGCYHLDEAGTAIKTLISRYIYPTLVRVDRLNRVYNLLLSKDQIAITLDQVNNHPKTWINFKNCMLDVLTFEQHPHDPAYRSVNQIPHAWNPSEVQKKIGSSLFDRYYESWIPAEDDRRMVLQYCGYSMTTMTIFQTFLILVGNGNVGKSVFLRLVQFALGSENCSSLSLQRLSGRESRFATYFLVGKIANVCGDISSAELQDTSVMKTVTGEDRIVAEIKGGSLFSFTPYCKFFFSANRVPPTREDRSGGYYRRLLILRIWKRCEDIPNLEERLRADVDVFIFRAISALHDMFVDQDGREIPIPQITRSVNSETEVNELFMYGDSAQAFLYRKTREVRSEKVEAQVLYNHYLDFCLEEERTPLKRNSFYLAVKDKGYRYNPSHGKQYFYGLTYDEGGRCLTPDEIDDLPF